MKSIICKLIPAVFLLTACATNEINTGNQELDAQIISSSKSVNFITQQQTNWCQTSSSCFYQGEAFCTVEGQSRQKSPASCTDKLAISTIKNGGDTIVLQDAGFVAKYPGKNLYYRAYGQVYNCTDKFKSLHARYRTINSARPDSALMYQSNAYAKQCKNLQKCKFYKQESCSSLQLDPFGRCMKKFNTLYNARPKKSIQSVISSEYVDTNGNYRLFTTLYICK